MPSRDFELEQQVFRAFHQAHAAELSTLCQALQKRIAGLLSGQSGLQVSKVEGRVKQVDECLRKFSAKYRPALEDQNQPYSIQPHITDLLGLRVVCLYEDEIWKIAEAIRPNFGVIEITDKIAKVEGTDDSFGYKGLHLDLAFSPVELGLSPDMHWPVAQFELQVRTIIQDSWSVLDHQIKYKKSIPNALKRRINVLSALFELADREFRQIRDETEAALQSAPDETALEGLVPEAPVASPEAQAKAELNAFTFLKIANHFFKDFAFEPSKVDGFVEHIKSWAPEITRPEFNVIVREKIGTVKRYKQFFEERHPQLSFNPYTVIRHCLYLGDKVVFAPALRRSAQEAFEAWLAEYLPPDKVQEG
ncbi:RelA/SpoT domain-containing protein [Curvibacter sp. HBC28]|uniref:RelA/SpoT domain-containing protein n=1 Tax=Curvibacter microcysteis TaxID=3026419 RepID=A0ABT5MIS4_9BURK|nr:RelA/SpoT domain-containing protein [Curvibacter sp. HBC28]MDD0815789.1 RelA/SpoT domain-containing protein [Curvibacter sp. HBC28]